jgi:GDP-mannose transporter
LTIPVYTIFKNLTIILIAYGEVLWFGGSVTPMTLASFSLMVSVLRVYVAYVPKIVYLPKANRLQVLSSLVAAWDDIGRLLSSFSASAATLAAISDADAAASARTAAGYAWMMVNCLASAGYVLGMRKRIKVTNFKVRRRSLVSSCIVENI